MNLAGCGQPRTSQSLQVAVSPAPVCQRNVVLAVVFVVGSVWCEQLHFASCEGQKVDLSKHELEALAQQIRADLDRIDGGTETASSSHTAGATAHGCHGGHGEATHAGNPTERSTAGGDERNLDGAQHEGIEVGSRPVRVAGPKDSPQGATLRRATDVVENLRVPMESLPQALGQNRRPTKDVRNGDLDLENQELSMQLYFGPCDATRERGGVDRDKREPRRRCRGMETDSGRVCLDRAGKRLRHVGLEPSARTARRAQERKEKARTTRRVGKGPGQGKGSGTQNPHADRECFYCHRKGHIKEECRIRMADEKDNKNQDEKDKREDKRAFCRQTRRRFEDRGTPGHKFRRN